MAQDILAHQMTSGTDSTDAGVRPPGGKLREVLLVLGVTILCAVVLKTFFVEAYRIPSSSMENTLLTGDMILVNKFSYGLRFPSSFPFISGVHDAEYAFSFSRVRRGDVIVFELPRAEEPVGTYRRTAFVKRCIGIPGDTVEIRSSRIHVNGREMLEPRTVRTPVFHQTLDSRSLYPAGAGFTEWQYGPVYVPGRGDLITLEPGTMPVWRHVLEREGHRVDVTEEGSILVDGMGLKEYEVSRDYYFVLGDHRENSTDSRVWGFVCEDDVVGEALLVYWSSAPSDAYSGETDAFRNIRWDRVGGLVR